MSHFRDRYQDLLLDIDEYIKSLDADLEHIEKWEEDIRPLDCCDNRELETLSYVRDSLKQIMRKYK